MAATHQAGQSPGPEGEGTGALRDRAPPPSAHQPRGICVSIAQGKPTRATGDSAGDFIPQIKASELAWVNFEVKDLRKDGLFAASILGFSGGLMEELMTGKLSGYEDRDSELGLLLPVVRVTKLDVAIHALVILLRPGLILTMHEEGKVTRMTRLARYADVFMRKIPTDAPASDRVTLLLMRILNENNERNFEGLRTIEEQGDRIGGFLVRPEAPIEELGPEIYALKHALITYLDSLWASLDVLQSLRWGDAETITDNETVLARLGLLMEDVRRHIQLSEHMSEVLASGLEVLQGIHNNQLQKLNNQLAMVVAYLTILGTAVLVPNTIATIVSSSPGLWPLGNPSYLVFLALSTVAATWVSYAWVKGRGYLEGLQRK